MALQKRVSELPAVTTVAGTDLLIVSSNNATKRTSVQQIGAYFAANGVAGPPGPQGPQGLSGTGNWDAIADKPATFPPSAHTHAISEVVGLSAALDGKQAAGSYATLVGGKVPESQLPPIVTTWEGLTGKPSTFPPSAHSHAIGDVTGLQTALDGKQASGSYAASVHTHGISDVTGLQTVLDGKAASSHTHTIANVTGLQSALDAKATPADVTSAVASVVNAAPASLDTLKELADALGNDANFASTVTNAIAGKAAAVHTHVIADVTGLQTALDGKQAAGSYAAAVHTHGISDVTGLQTALDGKAAATHGHAIADVTGLQAALDGKQASGSYAAASHGHVISDVTGLQTALDGKSAVSHTHSAQDVSGLATVATSGAYADLTGRPTLGTAAAAATTDFVAANDARLTDQRVPTDGSVTTAKLADASVTDAKIADVAASKLTGTVALARLPVVLEQTQTVGNSGTSTTLALTTGSVQTVTLSGNCTFTMPSPTAGASITLILTQGGTFTATFTGVLWSGGTAPTITATSNKRDILVFVSDGTNWYGTVSQNH